MPDTTENKLNFSWKRFTEEDFNKRKDDLLNEREWKTPALVDVGAVNIELHDPEYSNEDGRQRVFIDYYIGGDTSGNPYSDDKQEIPYGHADGDSIPVSAMTSSSYEEFKKYFEDEVATELSRPDNLKVQQEAERPTVDWNDPKQHAELYITKLAEKVDLAEQKDRRTWQFVRDNHPGYHDDVAIASDPIFSDNDVYRGVVAGEMSVESAERFVELRGTKADFAREFIRTEKEVLDDAIENWQPEEADENGEPVGNVPDYVQEFHDVVNNCYDEMDKAVDIINFENEKESFLNSLSGGAELNTTLEIDDDRTVNQYFVYPNKNLPGIKQEYDKDGNLASYLRLVVDIDQKTGELYDISVDRGNSETGDFDYDVQNELTGEGKKLLDSLKDGIKKYIEDDLREEQVDRIEELFDGKYSIDDGNSRMSFRETLDFYNKEDADRPYSERLNHAVSRMLYYSLYLPDDNAGEKRWQICDDVAEKITGGEIKQLFDGIKSAQEIADQEAKEKFGYSWQDKTNALSDLLDAPGEVTDPDGHPADLDHMIHYYEENTPLEGHRRNLEKAVSRMLMFTINDFKSLEPENYDGITQDGAAAELRYELEDRIARDLVSGKIKDGWTGINKDVEDYSKEIADREFEKLKEDGRFVEAELAADRAAAHGEADFYSKNFTAGEWLKFNSLGGVRGDQTEKLGVVLGRHISKDSISDEEASLIDKYLFSKQSNVAWLRFDRDKGDLYLQRYMDDGESKFTRTSLKGVLELVIENAEKAEDAGAVLTLQKRLNELRGVNQNTQRSESKEKSVEKQTTVQKETAKEDVFGDFVNQVESEYKDLKLFLRSAANVLKHLPPEKQKEIRKELLKRGARSPEAVATVMRNAVKAKQHARSQQQKNPEKKRDDYGMER